ncbi:MAG: sigma-70 family RNA polymerase sigma factor [FCB group bacterium]|nr:sigma-70 family RNA polymerase sigma factor [FCB group bacterium]
MSLTESRARSSIKETDEVLIKRFQDGETDAFTELVSRYKDPLFNYVSRMLKDRVYAEDIVQETFVRVYRNRDRYQQIAKFSTWIYTIAINLTKTELRRQNLRRFFSLSGVSDSGKALELPDNKINLEKSAEDSIVGQKIKESIDQLPKTFREVIILRDIQELSYEEISKITGVPLGTVKSRVNRGRTRLQKLLKDLRPRNSKSKT